MSAIATSRPAGACVRVAELPFSPLTIAELRERYKDASQRAANLLVHADHPGAIVSEEEWVESAREAAREYSAYLDAMLHR